MSSPIVLIIPGQLPIASLTATSATQLSVDVPCLAPQVCVSLIPAHCDGVLGPTDGIGVYVTDFQNNEEDLSRGATTANFVAENYHFLGYVSLERPSIQPRLPATMRLDTVARFGFLLESVATLKNIASSPTANAGSPKVSGGAFPSVPADQYLLHQQQQQQMHQQQWGGDYGFNTSYQQTQQQQQLQQQQSPAAVRIGRTIVDHIHTFLTSFAKVYAAHDGDAQSREALYLPPNWEQLWFAKFVAKRDAGAYNGDE